MSRLKRSNSQMTQISQASSKVILAQRRSPAPAVYKVDHLIYIYRHARLRLVGVSGFLRCTFWEMLPSNGVDALSASSCQLVSFSHLFRQTPDMSPVCISPVTGLRLFFSDIYLAPTWSSSTHNFLCQLRCVLLASPFTMSAPSLFKKLKST
jgi:hypothetical protein